MQWPSPWGRAASARSQSGLASMPRRVAIAGLGPIGSKLARALDEGISGFTLSAVAARDAAKAAALLSGLANPPPIVPIAALEGYADLVIEGAPAPLLPAVLRAVPERR